MDIKCFGLIINSYSHKYVSFNIIFYFQYLSVLGFCQAKLRSHQHSDLSFRLLSRCQVVNTCSATFNLSLMNPIQAGCYSINCNVVNCIGSQITNAKWEIVQLLLPLQVLKEGGAFRVVGIIILVVIILWFIA